MIPRYFAILSVLILSWPWSLPAQPAEIAPRHWREYTIDDGLGAAPISQMTLGAKGRIWITYENAPDARVFDGYTIESMEAPVGEDIEIHESRTGQLWTILGGSILRAQDGNWIPTLIDRLHDSERREWLNGPLSVRAVMPANYNHALAITDTYLFVFDSDTRVASLISHAEDWGLGEFRDLKASLEVGGWVITERGALRIGIPLRRVSDSSAFEPFPIDIANDRFALSHSPIVDDRGGLTMTLPATPNARAALAYVNSGRWRLYETPFDNTICGWRVSDSHFWIATSDAIHSIPATTGSGEIGQCKRVFQAGGEPIVDVEMLLDGSALVATTRSLLRYAPPLWRTSAQWPEPWPKDAIESPNTWTSRVFTDHSRQLWFGAKDGLYRFGADKMELVGDWPYPPAQSAQFRGIVDPNGDQLFFESTDAIQRVDLRNPEDVNPVPFLSNADARLVGATSDGSPIVVIPREDGADGRQIAIYDGESLRRIADFPDSWTSLDSLTFCHITSSQSLWLGSLSGVAEYREGSWRFFAPESQFRYESGHCMIERSDGTLWFGTEASIVSYDGRVFADKLVDCGRVGNLIETDAETVWAATMKGVFHYRENQWTLNSVEEGLSEVSFLVLEGPRRQLFTVCDDGLYQYEQTADTDPPETRIETSSVDRRPGPGGGALVRFGADDKWRHTLPKDLRYSHKLDDREWSEFRLQSEVALRGLATGDHVLLVRSMDRNRNKDQTPAEYTFSWTIPWYRDPETVTAALLGTLFALVFAGVAYNRHRRLQRSYAEVERIVEERTQELERANHELLMSQKMRAMGALTAGVAHDFNSILSIIGGSAQIIGSNPGDKDKVLKRVERIRHVVDQGSTLVKSMLGFARPTLLDKSRVDINEVVDQVVTNLGDRLGPNISFARRLDLRAPQTTGDRNLILQLLTNLALNASDAVSDSGEIVFETGFCEPEVFEEYVLKPETAPRYVFISVSDQGVGMTQEEIERAFEPFYTTKAFSSRRGTGLGLPMVYEFALRMGYGLHVTSELGAGARFTVLAPVATEE